MNEINMEIFKNIPGIEGYQISNYQNIKSMYDSKGKSREMIIKVKKEKNGYVRAALYQNKKRQYYLVHRLIGAAFHGLDLNDKKQLALHKNDIRDDNRPENIFIGTHSDNIQDMLSKKRGVDNKGTKNGMAKLTKENIIEIRNNYKGISQSKIANMYGVSQMVISRALRGNSYINI